MTIQSDLETLISELEDNLQAMGVYDAEFDATTGIRGLVARIVDINPSLTGVALTTAVSCSSSHQTIVMGNTITITGVLTATYDDRSVTNVDLSGYLQGATINIYNGQTLLGTAITDSNGAYTFSYTTNTITNLSILAQFDGTDDYSSCASNNVAVSVTGEITLTGNKTILSAADHETLSLTAYLTDTIIENVDINFYKEGNNMTKTLIGTATTDANGVATITYESTGAGDINIVAECEGSNGTLVSKTYSIRDAVYYSTDVISTSADVLTPLNLSGIPINFKCSFTFKKTSYSLGWIQIGSDANNNIFFGCVGSGGQLGVYSRVNGSYEVTDVKSNVFSNNSTSTVEFECKYGVLTCSANNQTVTINTSTISSRTYQAVHTKDNGAVSNILIMPL